MKPELNRKGRREVEKSGQVNRQFNYSKGEINKPSRIELNFSLRVDTKTELKDFLELLVAAQEDVAAEIAK